MRRRSVGILRSMQTGVGRAWNAYMRFLARVAGVLHAHQDVAIPVAVLTMSLSIVFQSRIDAAGLTWWSNSGRYTMFVFTLAFATLGPTIFNRSGGQTGGGAMRTSPGPG